ncbi:MAG TPA: hypothetical protein VFH51_20880, partial [Myxococcota bacterium]|nr:hypothetical protein [Myxococcota bacterium]
STSTDPILAVTGDIFAGGQPFLPPGVFVPPVCISPTGALAKVVPFGLLGVLSLYLPSINQSLSGIGYAAAGGIGLFGVNGYEAAATRSLTFLFGNNFATGGFSTYRVTGTILNAYAVALAGWRDYLGVSGQFLWADQTTRNLALVGGLIAKTARRDTFDMGPYLGDDAETLAHAHGLQEVRGLRRLELRHRTGNTFNLRGGGGSVTLAALLRVDINTNRDIIYRTFVSRRRARDVLFEGRGLAFFVKGKLRALGWKKEILPIPRLEEPDSIPLGDEVQQVRSGTWVIGALLGNLAGWVTTQIWFRGDMELAVRKIGPRQVELVQTPLKVRARSTYVVEPFGPHLGVRHAHARGNRQAMIYDLDVPEARRHYLETIRGQTAPPSPLRRMPSPATLRDKPAWDAHFAPALPPGVHRTFAQAMDGRLDDAGGGLKWILWPRELLPKNFELGLTHHRRRRRELLAVTDGATLHTLTSLAHTSVSERFAGGLKALQ